MGGKYDRQAPQESQERLAAAITGAKLHLFEEGHQFLIQDREADYGTIIDHLKSYPGQPVAGTCVSGTILSAFATIYAPGGNIAHQYGQGSRSPV